MNYDDMTRGDAIERCRVLEAKDNRCECSMSISVLGDGCRYCQPQEYIDRLHEQMEDELSQET